MKTALIHLIHSWLEAVELKDVFKVVLLKVNAEEVGQTVSEALAQRLLQESKRAACGECA